MPTSSGLVIRRLEAADWPVLRELRLSALREAPRAFLFHDGDESPTDPRVWSELISRKAWFAAFDGTMPVGLASTIRDPDSDDPYIESMWVSPSHRKLGVGTDLLLAIEAVATEARKTQIFLWVLDGNDGARRFYVGAGFRPTGRRQGIGPRMERVEEEFVRAVPSSGVAGRAITTPVPAAR